MANYLSDRTGASIDAQLDKADTSNIGKSELPSFSGDCDTIVSSGYYRLETSATNKPIAGSGVINCMGRSSGSAAQIFIADGSDDIWFRRKVSATFQPWQELYHTGNTVGIEYQSSGASDPDGSTNVLLTRTTGSIRSSRTGTGQTSRIAFYNGNGQVGDITTNGTATAYVTSSDPRLKVFAPTPTDSAINAEFNSLFSCFRTFNWKSDLQGDLVWGFDAHACVDANTGIGSEGEGPRNLSLGDTYETIPAVTESRVVMDSEGNPTSEVETVVITPAINKKVSPAGVDQSKAVPILLAKIEQLERRLTAAGL